MTPARPKPKRASVWPAWAAFGMLLAGGAGLAIGPGAAGLVDLAADGQRVWRLGHINVDGVTGSWLGDLRADHVAIADEEGVWLQADNVAIEWRPHELLFGAVNIDNASARRIDILRQPALLERRSAGRSDMEVRIGAAQVETLVLAAPTVGEAAQFTSAFSLEVRDRSLAELDLSLQRTDADTDRLTARYDAEALYALRLDVFGAAGGVFAHALGAHDQEVRANAEGSGNTQNGEIRYEAAIGESKVFGGAARWTPAQWNISARAELGALAPLQALARRIGPQLALDAAGARAGAFTAHAETAFATLDLSGALDAGRRLAGPARFVARATRLSDIARESPFELGAAQVEGELRRERGVSAIRATAEVSDVAAFGARARLSGAVRASLSGDRFTLEGELRAPRDAAPLFAHMQLRAALRYDRDRRRFQLDRAEIEGDAGSVDARGWAIGGDGEFSGEWRVRRLAVFAPQLRGEAGGRWRAFREDLDGQRAWAATLAGRGMGIGGQPAILAQALGAAPRFDARIRYEFGGLTVAHARLDGQQLRAGVTGRIVRGEAALTLEASARAPLALGGAEISGALDAQGAITGRVARPSIAVQATFASFVLGGARIEQPLIELTLAPSGEHYIGRAEVRGGYAGQHLAAGADIGVEAAAVRLANLDGRIGGLQARGAAAFDARGISAQLAINGALDGLAPGVTGRMSGELTLAPERLVLTAQIADARSGELFVRAATLRAEGPLDAVVTQFDLRGRLRQAPLTFGGTGALAAADGATIVSVEGRGQLAGADIFTRAPLRLRFAQGSRDASLNFAVGDGVVVADWRERGRALAGSAQLEGAPLAPLAAIWGERAEGRIDGRVMLESAGADLSGEAELRLAGARLAGRQRGRIDMRVSARLEPRRLRATIDASSTDGLVAHFEADAPVVTASAPIRIALAPERNGRATWTVAGPAESLWAAARLPDQTLAGRVDGQGEIEFGAGRLTGAGYIEIVDGRFEDKLTGVTLADLDARIALDQRGVTIDRFSATDPHGGRLSATGGSATPREGRVRVIVDNMRVADRPEARARASGELELAWEGMHAELSGNLNIVEAELDITANPESGIPTIEVIEINHADGPEGAEQPASMRRNGSTELDVRVRAPGRVFTRGRGVDAEWSLDLRLAGTARNPLIFGQARAVRGTMALSGQPFDIDEARISFDGDPIDAQIDLTATRATPDLTAYVRLSGTARDPEVSFTSDPGLPEDEILPQVLFGRSVEDLSAFEAAQLAASLAALSGQASLDLVNAARAAAGLDRFNVRQDEDGGFLVAGGVYLTRDVYVEVARTGLGQAQSRVEWTVRPRLVLITSFLGNGDQSISLRWRRETD